MSVATVNKTILEEVEQFCHAQIRPYAGDFEKKEGVPDHIITEMANRSYLGASFPKEYGGLGLDPVTFGLFTEQFGKACPSTRALLTVHTSLVGGALLKWASESQRKKWLSKMAKGEIITAFALTEPDIGTDAKNIKTNYKKVDDHYVLNGKKKWITYGHYADMFLTFASDNGVITAFMVDRNFSGVKTTPMKGLVASKAAYIAEIEFDNVVIPKDNVIGKEGNGFAFIANTSLDHGRYSIAWAGIAVAQAACEYMISYSRKRSQFNKKIFDFQLIKGIIADSITEIHAARALCLKAGKMRESNDNDAVIETTIAKYYASKVAMKVTTNAMQVFGGNGCIDTFPVERLFREAKILEIIEGTSQVLQEVIAMHGGRKYFKRDLLNGLI